MDGILDPLAIRGLTLRNRFVLPPMNTGLATSDGAVTGSLIDYYVQRSEVLGLVIVEHSFITLEGKNSLNQLGIYDDNLISGLKELAHRIHETGASVIIQINHVGKLADAKITGTQPVAPSYSDGARQLEVKEIKALAMDFALAAERAVQAGFDGVELHGCHGYLLNQFFSPLANRRTDNYGGSIKNRMRFPLEVIKTVRKKIGGKILSYRLGVVDLVLNGVKIADSKKFATKMEKAGVDVIHVSGGFCGSSPESLQTEQGYFIPYAQKIKKVVKIPIIGVGGITDPKYADKIIREGKVDLVAVGRALYNDPNWAKKAIKQLQS